MLRKLWHKLVGKPDITGLEVYELLAESIRDKQTEIDYIIVCLATLEDQINALKDELNIK